MAFAFCKQHRRTSSVGMPLNRAISQATVTAIPGWDHSMTSLGTWKQNNSQNERFQWKRKVIIWERRRWYYPEVWADLFPPKQLSLEFSTRLSTNGPPYTRLKHLNHFPTSYCHSEDTQPIIRHRAFNICMALWCSCSQKWSHWTHWRAIERPTRDQHKRNQMLNF